MSDSAHTAAVDIEGYRRIERIDRVFCPCEPALLLPTRVPNSMGAVNVQVVGPIHSWPAKAAQGAAQYEQCKYKKAKQWPQRAGATEIPLETQQARKGRVKAFSAHGSGARICGVVGHAALCRCIQRAEMFGRHLHPIYPVKLAGSSSSTTYMFSVGSKALSLCVHSG